MIIDYHHFKNTIRDGGSTVPDTAYTVYTVHTVFTAFTIKTALHCFKSSRYISIYYSRKG